MTDHKTLAQALVAFQADAPRVKKDKTAQVRSDKGNYSYTYADLADMVAVAYPILSKHGLAFTSKPTLNADGRFVLAYRLVHGPSGETDEGEIALPSNGTPQAMGAAMTYAKRQALSAVTGIVADEDNDAHDGGQVQYSRKKPQQGKQPEPQGPTADQLRETIANLAKAKDLDHDALAKEYEARIKTPLAEETDPGRLQKFVDAVNADRVQVPAAS